MIVNKKRNLLVLLIIIPITVVFNYTLLKPEESTSSLSQMLVSNLYDVKSIYEKKTLILAANSIYFIVFFHLLFGIYIYKDFISNGAYIFTRLKSRKIWFYQKAFQIIKYSMIYSILFIGTLLILCSHYKKELPGIDILYTVFFLWFSCSFLITLTTIVINIVAIYRGSAVGFLIGYGSLILLISLSINFETIPLLGNYALLSIINPASIMFLYLLNQKTVVFLGFVYYIALTLFMINRCANLVNKIDVSVPLNENG